MYKLGEIFLQQRLESANVTVDVHTALFSHWWAMLEVLYFMIVSYTGAHVLDMNELCFSFPGHLSMPTESLGWPIGSKSLLPLEIFHLQFLPLSCLSDFLRHRNVWVASR